MNNLVPHLTRFEPLRVMAIFGTYLRAGRGSEPVWFQGTKISPKVPVIYGTTSGGPNPKLMMTLKKKLAPLILIEVYGATDEVTNESTLAI